MFAILKCYTINKCQNLKKDLSLNVGEQRGKSLREIKHKHRSRPLAALYLMDDSVLKQGLDMQAG